MTRLRTIWKEKNKCKKNELSYNLNVTDPLIIPLIFNFLSCRETAHDEKIQSWKFKTSSKITNHYPLSRTVFFLFEFSFLVCPLKLLIDCYCKYALCLSKSCLKDTMNYETKNKFLFCFSYKQRLKHKEIFFVIFWLWLYCLNLLITLNIFFSEFRFWFYLC